MTCMIRAIIRITLKTTQKGHQAEATACFAAVPGATFRGTRGLRTGSGTIRRYGATTAGFALLLPPSSYFLSSDFLFSIPPY